MLDAECRVYDSMSSTSDPPLCSLRIASATISTVGTIVSRDSMMDVSSRNGGTESVTNTRSSTADERMRAASPMKRPWVATARIRLAPHWRHARATSSRVPPVLIMSSTTTATLSSISP